MGFFISMGKIPPSCINVSLIQVLMIMLIYVAPGLNPAWAGGATANPTDLTDVVVTGTRMPGPLSSMGRSMTVISREDIENLPVDNIPDLLETVSGLDVRQRGGPGVQADVSIRGGSFEQTLILVDGINMSDAQTGHHNMNLPVNIKDIDRIEIIKGPGAWVYGHNAMAGVINIITRKPDQNRAGASAGLGGYDYVRLDGNMEGNIGGTSHRISASRRASSGYITERETDFDVQTLTYRGTVRAEAQSFNLGLGYTQDDFGAYKFYSDTFPNQREETKTLMVYGNGEISLPNLVLSPGVFFRQNRDVYDIEIGGDWYENEHRTNSYGAQINSGVESAAGKTAFGGEAAVEDIESSNLGDHERNRFGLFLEHRISPLKKTTLSAGISAMKYSGWGWETWPGAEVNIEFPKGVNCFASAGRSFRIPTYTELYYDTAANQGNPDLFPERAWTYEVGIRRVKNGLGLNAGLFYRDAENLIDWSREPGEAVWKVRNIADSKTRGIELGTDLYPGLVFDRLDQTVLHLSYTGLDSGRNTGDYESKYILDHLRHQVNGSVSVNWSDRVTQTITARYARRLNEDFHVTADTRLTYHARRYGVFLDITNIFNEDYVDSGFAPAPGRWIVVGMRVDRDF